MMPATAVGMAGGRNETGIIALADAVASTIGLSEGMIVSTIDSVTATTGVIRDFTSAYNGTTRGFATVLTEGLTPAKRIVLTTFGFEEAASAPKTF